MERANNTVEIYQLYIWLKHISPMIWRRLLVRNDVSIADLHYYIQIIMGWENYHLNQFTIRQGLYGVYCIGGMSFPDNPHKVYLKDFDFRINEKFIYEYNLHIPWEHEIRLEKKLPLDTKIEYPVCIGGKNAGPSEDPYSIEEFVELLESSKPTSIFFRCAEVVEEYEEGVIDRESFEEIIDDLKDLTNKFIFSRKDINDELQDYTNNGN